MKTLNQINGKKLSASSMMFFVAAIMGINFLSSCTKEDSSSMAPSGSTFENSEDLRNTTVPIPAVQLVKEAGFNPTLAVYNVSVYENGDVIYEGKKNVAVRGLVRSHLDQGAFDELIKLFSVHHFMDMKNNYPGIEEESQRTVTTFAFNQAYKSVSDYGMRIPADLIMLQREIISKLKIERLIGGPVSFDAQAIKAGELFDANNGKPIIVAADPGQGLGETKNGIEKSNDVSAKDRNDVFHSAASSKLKIDANEIEPGSMSAEGKITEAGNFNPGNASGKTKVNISELKNAPKK